jgi:hypothetical protein
LSSMCRLSIQSGNQESAASVSGATPLSVGRQMLMEMGGAPAARLFVVGCTLVVGCLVPCSWCFVRMRIRELTRIGGGGCAAVVGCRLSVGFHFHLHLSSFIFHLSSFISLLTSHFSLLISHFSFLTSPNAHTERSEVKWRAGDWIFRRVLSDRERTASVC